jgi:copper chaperone NosL
VTRLIAALGTVGAAVVFAVVFLWPSAPTGPEPIVWGRDTCAQCRMHLTGPGFAGELRDGHGRLTKYDDVGCLVRAMRGMHEEMPGVWVEDHAGGGFVPLLGAHLVRTGSGETPMGSGLVAFADEDAARRFVTERGGEIVALEDLAREP